MLGDNIGKHEQYRKGLAEDLTTIRKQDPEKAQEVLDKEKEKREYVAADAWQDTVGRPAKQDEIKTKKEKQDLQDKINKLKELGVGIFSENHSAYEDGKFIQEVILKGQDFSCKISDLEYMYGIGSDPIGENLTDYSKALLKKLKFKDYNFIVKYIKLAKGGSFNITPLKEISNTKDFKKSSKLDDIVKNEGLIKVATEFYEYKSEDNRVLVKIPSISKDFSFGFSFGDNDNMVQKIEEIEKEYEKTMM